MRGRKISSIAVAPSLGLTGRILGQPSCDPLPPPAGPVMEVWPSQAAGLAGLVSAASSGTTILLHDGLFLMDGGDATCRLVFDTAGVTLRSVSGEAAKVVLDGGYVTGELVNISASNVTIADVTLTRAFYHPIHVSGSAGTAISGTLIHNVRVVDPGEQAIKINPVGEGWADEGMIECSDLELTGAGRSRIRNGCYTGGIDAHAARGWIVRRNRIAGFWCPSGLSEHAIHFWRASRDTLVEENVIVDCARGIGFGLGQQGGVRRYPDDPYPTVAEKGHIDGIVRNNFVAASEASLFASSSGFDTGIGLEQAVGARVLHNTVAAAQAPVSSSIEWRFSSTSAELGNNLVTHTLLPRDGGHASLAGNITGAPLSWFVDPVRGDLHLSAVGLPAVDAGVPLARGWADFDIDTESRVSLPDVGADERLGSIFDDGFESGEVSAWSLQR